MTGGFQGRADFLELDHLFSGSQADIDKDDLLSPNFAHMTAPAVKPFFSYCPAFTN